MMYVLLVAIVIIAFFLIMHRVEWGFVLVIIIPVIKDIFQLPEDQIPFLNLLFLFLLFTIISFIYEYSSKIHKVKIHKEYLTLFIIFTSIVLFSLIYTSELIYGADKALKFLLFNGFYFIGGMIVFQNISNVDRFISFLKYSILTISLISVILLVKNFLSGALLKQIMVRFSISGNYPMTMARVTGLGALLWFYSIFSNNKSTYKIFSVFAFVNIFIALIATNTRGPLFFVILIGFIFLLFYSHIPIKKKVLFIFLFFLLVLLVLVSLPKNMINRIFLLFQSSNLKANTSIFSVSSAGRRLIFYDRLLDYLAKHPEHIFLGNGSGSFASLFQDYSLCQYPHNIFLEILFEQGIVGLTIFSLSIFILIKDIYLKFGEMNKIKSSFIPLIFGVSYFFLNSLISGDIDNNRLLWLFWGGIIGLFISIDEKKNNNIRDI